VAPALVLLHGFTHTGSSWDPVIAALGETYRGPARPLAPDIRGHGSASGRVPVTLEAVLEDVAALAVDRFTLAGYSMGGRIALHAALAMPERVERLVLIGASPGIEDAGERARRVQTDERLAAEIESSSIGEFAERWAATPVLAGQPDAVRAAVHADRLRNRPDGLARALRGLGTGTLPSLWPRLKEVRAPVVLVVGERDEKFRMVAQQMALPLPSATVVVVKGAGHACHLEAPEAVAAVIASAIASSRP
jgi:2-succinyl-6-hydroxy-2,4-cyclohexadiene-1-carboxylate synthase